MSIFKIFIGSFLLFALVACGGGGGEGKTQPSDPVVQKAKWAYLVYIAADNNLEPYISPDLEMMKAAKASPEVKIVVQVDDGKGATRRGTIENGELKLTSLESNIDMGDKKNLTAFVAWAKQNYPAERYALTLWSHGNGWRSRKTSRGALADDTSRSFMSMADMREALQQAGGVDIVDYDACLMAMYEVAYMLKDVAKVMVAPEEVATVNAQPYERIINRLVENPALSAADFARGIVDDIGTAKNTPVYSAIDLSKIDTLHRKVQETASLLMTSMATDEAAIQKAIDDAPYYDVPEHRDLIRFAESIANSSASVALKNKAEELATAAREAVIRNYVGSDVNGSLKGSSGIAIYLPLHATLEKDKYDSTYLFNAEVVPSGKSWSDFLHQWMTQTKAAGNFAYTVSWDNPDVVVDLVILEAKFALYPYGHFTSAPILMYTLPYDGEFSGGLQASSWTYKANPLVDKGDYEVLVRIWGCEKTPLCKTNVNVEVKDPFIPGVAIRTVSGTLDKSNPLPSGDVDTFSEGVRNGLYSDHLYVGKTTR